MAFQNGVSTGNSQLGVLQIPLAILCYMELAAQTTLTAALFMSYTEHTECTYILFVGKGQPMFVLQMKLGTSMRINVGFKSSSSFQQVIPIFPGIVNYEVDISCNCINKQKNTEVSL